MTHNPNALVFAASGAISQAVARSLAERGATVWLAGRDDRTAAFAERLRTETPGSIHTALVDATNEDEVARFVSAVRNEAGTVDIAFNGIGGPPAELRYPRRTVEASVEDFMLPIQRIVGSQFLTARECGRVMVEQEHGVILTLSATLSGMTAMNMAGITAACGAIEAMTRALAGDFGPAGVRVNCVRSSALPETRTIQDTFAGQASILGEPMPMVPPPLGRPVRLGETAAAVAWLASPEASGITGQVLTVCAGQFVGQG
jgi:NAD(P)-dependent dehydrogenase (short-subunit alcohol dehydrogenase family)